MRGDDLDAIGVEHPVGLPFPVDQDGPRLLRRRGKDDLARHVHASSVWTSGRVPVAGPTPLGFPHDGFTGSGGRRRARDGRRTAPRQGRGGDRERAGRARRRGLGGRDPDVRRSRRRPAVAGRDRLRRSRPARAGVRRLPRASAVHRMARRRVRGAAGRGELPRPARRGGRHLPQQPDARGRVRRRRAGVLPPARPRDGGARHDRDGAEDRLRTVRGGRAPAGAAGARARGRRAADVLRHAARVSRRAERDVACRLGADGVRRVDPRRGGRGARRSGRHLRGGHRVLARRSRRPSPPRPRTPGCRSASTPISSVRAGRPKRPSRWARGAPTT